MDTNASVWALFAGRIQEHLNQDDDVRLWQAALDTVLGDARFLCRHHRAKPEIVAQVGCCARWLSPHNKGSWFRYKRFAWASGYERTGRWTRGLPAFEWVTTWRWVPTDSSWEPLERIGGTRRLLFRVAVPARTARHVRAIIHTCWLPRTPTTSDKLLRAYAFVKTDSEWRFDSVSGRRGEKGAVEYEGGARRSLR
jgi:hypothetical protein